MEDQKFSNDLIYRSLSGIEVVAEEKMININFLNRRQIDGNKMTVFIDTESAY